MRLIDADFEIAHYMSMIMNPTPDVNMYDRDHAWIIIEALEKAKLNQEKMRGEDDE